MGNFLRAHIPIKENTKEKKVKLLDLVVALEQKTHPWHKIAFQLKNMMMGIAKVKCGFFPKKNTWKISAFMNELNQHRTMHNLESYNCNSPKWISHNHKGFHLWLDKSVLLLEPLRQL